MDTQADLYVAALMRHSSEAVTEACRVWATERDGWPDLDQLISTAREADRPALGGPGPAAWQRIAERALSTLANCFIRRIGQLERGEHARFGRELADYAGQWPFDKIGENGRAIEAWTSQWLGVSFRDLMGEPPAPIDKSMRPRAKVPMPDMTGRERVVVEPEHA